MKVLNRQSLKFIIIFSIIFSGVYTRAKCDTKLLETFSLKGLHYSVSTPMHICPSIQDRCCTNMDQLRILKLWNSIGRVTTRMHNANLFQTYLGAFKYIEKIVPELDESNIIVTFLKHQWIPYIKHYCGQFSEMETDEDTIISKLIPGEGKWEKWDKVIPVEESKQKLMDEIDKITVNQYLRIVAHFVPMWDGHFDEMENYYYSEVDLKSIRVKELFTQGVNFQHEKNYFLYFLQIAANALINIYQKTDTYYQKKVQKAKIISYQETFLKEYKNFMFEAESFMVSYNKIDCPVKRYTELHIYAQLCKDKIKRMLEGLVLREKQLYLSIKEFERLQIKEKEDEIKRRNFKKSFQESQDGTKFKNMMSDVRDEHQQFMKEKQNGGKDSLNGMTSEEYFTGQFQANEKIHGMELPAEKLRKLGQRVIRQQMKEVGLVNRNLRRRRRRPKRPRLKRRRKRSQPLKDERLDFPSVALAEIIKFRKKSIRYALDIKYKKDLFWKNLIQSFVNTRYDFTPKQMHIVPPKKKKKRGIKRKFYILDQKQEYFFGKQKRIPNLLFNALEHPARLKRFMDSKMKFHKLEKFHRKQIFKPFTVNDRLFQVKNVSMPPNSSTSQSFECTVKGQHLYRSLMIQNKSKVQYCYRIIRNLKEEPIDILIQEIQKQITANLNILDLKKSIYCAVCDPNSQQLFHAPKKIIIYEEKFCYNLINIHHDYLTLMHVTLVEFIYKILQVLQCLKSTGDVQQLPFDTILDKRMKRVQFIKNCLENSEGSDFMKYCYNVCQQIDMLGFSKFWDGDVTEIQEIFVKVRSFATQMEIQPIPEVDTIEYRIPVPLIKDSFRTIHTRGEGFDEVEEEEREQDKEFIKVKQDQAFIINQTETAASKKPKTPKAAEDKIPEPDIEDSVAYQELCKKCPFGNDGINCRVKYCKKPTPCQMCQEGPDGTLCREKYCEFFKPFMKKYKSQKFDTSREHQPQAVNQDDLVTLVPKVVIKQKRFPKVHSRGLDDSNKITSENTELKQGRILALDDDDQSLRKEIYKKKLPLYDVQNYRNFFSANRYALNPLKMIRNVKFDQITPQILFKKQMDQFKNNSIQPEVVKDFLNIGKKQVKAFNKEIKIMFNPVVSSAKKHIRKSKALKKKLKHIRYIKNLKKTTVELELHRPYKFKYKMKKMPPYSFMLDDIGKNSNDNASKVMLGKVVRIFKDPKDPRDAVKPYRKKSKGKKKNEAKIAK